MIKAEETEPFGLNVEASFDFLAKELDGFKAAVTEKRATTEAEVIINSLESRIHSLSARLERFKSFVAKEEAMDPAMFQAAKEHLLELRERYEMAKQHHSEESLKRVLQKFEPLLKLPAFEAGIGSVSLEQPPQLNPDDCILPDIPAIRKLDQEEIDSVPSYILGRLTADKINPFIVDINRTLLLKYSLLYPLLLRLVNPGTFQPTALYNSRTWYVRTYDASNLFTEEDFNSEDGLVPYELPKFATKFSRSWATKFLELENEFTCGQLFFTEADLSDNLPLTHPKAFASYASHATRCSLLAEDLHPSAENCPPATQGLRSRSSTAVNSKFNEKIKPTGVAPGRNSSINKATLRNVLNLLRHMGKIKEVRQHNLRRLQVGQYSAPFVG